MICTHAQKQNSVPGFYHYPQKQEENTQSSRKAFCADLFVPQQKGREDDYEVGKITKIKPTRVLVKTFAKLHHLCKLYIFGFCFAVP